jgi:hypothetical protein
MVEGETHKLEPGMCFSIEPGIYLSRRFGVRIEDIVTVTADGGRRLNNTTREMQIVSWPTHLLAAGVLIPQRNIWGLWLGVGIACASALMTELVMFVFPLWAIAVLTIDFLVLFAAADRERPIHGLTAGLPCAPW